MDKRELIKEVKKRLEKRLLKPEWARKEVVEEAVNTVFEVIKEKVLGGEEVRIREFGRFYLKEVSPRVALNPKTKEKVKIKARRRFTFNPSSKIKFVEEK